ncbi:hypothetical protein C1645_832793 [Glomus cerebriforme]|uniref:Uncharacterized protein n=1 Tax=Glomus cerebriforme TaxID=658196 RepID=A0A397SHA0_9GLOM|nr:hypothetical protein C1645_832793 [Glomus cerebriforme]
MKKLDDYNSKYISLKRTVKRLEKYVKSLESELDILDECVDRETVVDLIHEIVPSLISRRGLKGNRNFSYTIETDTSEESDSGEIVEESHGYQVREKKAVPHALASLAKQRRRVRPRKVKRDQPVGSVQKNKAFRIKHLTALTNIPSKSTSPETSSSESNSSESGSSSETSSSESSLSSGSSSESSSSSETSSSESGSSDSDIDEIVKMIKHQRIRKQIRKRQRGVLEEECISSIRKIFSD